MIKTLTLTIILLCSSSALAQNARFCYPMCYPAPVRIADRGQPIMVMMPVERYGSFGADRYRVERMERDIARRMRELDRQQRRLRELERMYRQRLGCAP